MDPPNTKRRTSWLGMDGETLVGSDTSHFALGEGQRISFDMVFIQSCEEQVGVLIGNT